jgi:hypothetical protein
MTTGGTRVDGCVAVGAVTGAVGLDAGAGAVATVAGDEQATKANARRTSGDDFIRSSPERASHKDNRPPSPEPETGNELCYSFTPPDA